MGPICNSLPPHSCIGSPSLIPPLSTLGSLRGTVAPPGHGLHHPLREGFGGSWHRPGALLNCETYPSLLRVNEWTWHAALVNLYVTWARETEMRLFHAPGRRTKRGAAERTANFR